MRWSILLGCFCLREGFVQERHGKPVLEIPAFPPRRPSRTPSHGAPCSQEVAFASSIALGPLSETVRVLEAVGLLTPERIETLKAKAKATGAARAVRAAATYQQVVADYKRGRVKPLELASAHDELLAALRQNGDEVQSAVRFVADLFRASRKPRSPSAAQG